MEDSNDVLKACVRNHRPRRGSLQIVQGAARTGYFRVELPIDGGCMRPTPRSDTSWTRVKTTEILKLAFPDAPGLRTGFLEVNTEVPIPGRSAPPFAEFGGRGVDSACRRKDIITFGTARRFLWLKTAGTGERVWGNAVFPLRRSGRWFLAI
jgi:hypothetical protein